MFSEKTKYVLRYMGDSAAIMFIILMGIAMFGSSYVIHTDTPAMSKDLYYTLVLAVYLPFAVIVTILAGVFANRAMNSKLNENRHNKSRQKEEYSKWRI